LRRFFLPIAVGVCGVGGCFFAFYFLAVVIHFLLSSDSLDHEPA
jgi:hypothetical protein